jgi:hypothetical protein
MCHLRLRGGPRIAPDSAPATCCSPLKANRKGAGGVKYARAPNPAACSGAGQSSRGADGCFAPAAADARLRA